MYYIHTYEYICIDIIYTCIICVCVCMMQILYEYMRKQRPTFSSVRKVTLNGCYGINTNDNNNGVYPLLPFVYTYLRPLHHVNPDHRFPLLFILFLLPSEPFPSTFITVLLYIHFLYYIPLLFPPLSCPYSQPPYGQMCTLVLKSISTAGRMSTSGILLLYRHRRLAQIRSYIFSGLRNTVATSADHPQAVAIRSIKLPMTTC